MPSGAIVSNCFAYASARTLQVLFVVLISIAGFPQRTYPAQAAPGNAARSELTHVERDDSDGRVYGFEVAEPSVSAADFFRSYRGELRLGPSDDLVEISTEHDRSGYAVRRYAQYYRGIPVFAGSYVLYEKDGHVVRGHGNVVPGIDANVEAAIFESDAFVAAHRSLSPAQQTASWTGSSPARTPGVLGFVATSEDARASDLKLAYRYVFEGLRLTVDIDARSAEVLRKASGLEPANYKNASTTGQTYYDGQMDDMWVAGTQLPDCSAQYVVGQRYDTATPGIIVKQTDAYGTDEDGGFQFDLAYMKQVATQFTESIGAGGGSSQSIPTDDEALLESDPETEGAQEVGQSPPPPVCLTMPPPDFINVPDSWWAPINILVNLERMHRFLYGTFPSPDGQGGFIGFDGSTNLAYQAFYVQWPHNNAYASIGNAGVKDSLWFFSGDGVTHGPFVSMDSTVHESGHLIIRKAWPIKNAAEAHAVEEGFADIFAKIVEHGASNHFSWKMGHQEEMGTNLGKGERDFEDPTQAIGDGAPYPSAYGDTNWKQAVGTCSVENDMCFRHANASVADHWFYLLVEGGMGTNTLGVPYNVFGIGMDDAAQVAFLAMRELGMTPTYQTARAATLSAAMTIYPEVAPAVPSPQYIAVMDAWCAVGVGACYGADWESVYGSLTKHVAMDVDPWPYAAAMESKYPYVGSIDFTLSDNELFPAGQSVTHVENTDIKGSASTNFDLQTGQTYYVRTIASAGNSLCNANSSTLNFCAWMLANATYTGTDKITTSNEVFELNSPEDTADDVYPWSVIFSWGPTPSKGVQKYLFQITDAADVEFENALFSTMITASPPADEDLVLPVLSGYDYRWRTVAIANNDSLYNQAAFSLPNDSNAFGTGKPVFTPVSPVSGAHVAPWGPPIPLTWKATIGAVSYDIHLGDNAVQGAGTSIPYDGTTALVSNLDLAGCGTLADGKTCFWTGAARGTSVYGKEPPEVLPSSDRQTLVVDYSLLAKPVLSTAAVYAYTTPNDTVPFAWNALAGADHYVITVARPNNLPSIKSPAIPGNQGAYAMPGVRGELGVHSATVTAYGPAPDNVPISSVPISYTVTLAKASFFDPQPDLVYSPVCPAKFYFTMVPGADHIVFSLQRPDASIESAIVDQSTTWPMKGTEYFAPPNMPDCAAWTDPAGYHYWVAAYGPNGSNIAVQSDVGSYGILPMIPQAAVGSADANNPQVGISPAPLLQWTDTTPNATYGVQVTDITASPFAAVISKSGLSSTSLQVTLKPARKYEWHVMASLNGHDSTWSPDRYFKTGGACVPEVDAPELNPSDFKSGSGTIASPYIMGSTAGQPLVNGVAGVIAVPGAVDYQVFGEGTEPGDPGTVVADLLLDSNGTPWAQGQVIAGVEYAAFAQAEDPYGCWKASANPAYIEWSW